MRPIARQRLLLLTVILASVAGSIVYSAKQEPIYTATGSFAVQDQTRDLGVLGIPLAPSSTAAQVASSAARTLTRQAVISRVKEQLKSPLSGNALLARVSTVVDASSNLVEVSTTASTASGAQAQTNAFLLTATAVYNKVQRQSYASQAAELRRRLPPINKRSPARTEERAVYNQQISRLRALSAIAAPAKVVDAARRPKTPTSPRPVRNAILGGLLGLVLALSIVFLRDSFDRRLHSPADIEHEMEMPVFGHVRVGALGKGPRPGEMPLDPIDWEQFRIICRNLDFIDEGTRPGSLLVTSALPEEGKSTVALYLAMASAAAGRRTLLLECDLRRPVLAERLGINATPGITDFVAGTAEPSAILQTIEVGSQSTNGTRPGTGAGGGAQLVCVTAGSPTQHAPEVLKSDRFVEMFTQVKEAYDVVIVDSPPILPVVDALELQPRVAAVVMCARASKISRNQIRAGKAAFELLPKRPSGLVVTGTSRTDDSGYGYYAYD